MEITFETGYQMGKSKPIYLDKLTKEEADKLIAYFDRRMIPHKKLEIKQQTHQRKLSQP